MKKALLPIISLLLVTACAKPQTLGPQATRAEIMKEGRTQEQIIQQNTGKPSSKKANVASRVKATARKIIPATTALCEDLGAANPASCIYDIQITEPKPGEKDTLNAYADGKKIVLTSAMVRFARDDAELAFIMAHEYAHNFMRHVAAGKRNMTIGTLLGVAAEIGARSAGFDAGGQLAKMGAMGGRLYYSPEFEHEADYLALYLLARAGYDYKNTPNFWRRMSKENPKSIYLRSTHPSNAERFVVMNKTIAEINKKRANNQPLIPQLKQKAS